MTASLAPSTRLTVADYDEILSAGNEAAEYVDVLAWLRRDTAEADLFNWGTLVDDAARQVVVHLLMLGHPRVTAMRAAIQVEQRSITVRAPAEGWMADGR